MELCYDGVLTMPNNYIAMNNDEMEYTDGGDFTRLKNNLIGLCNRSKGIGQVFKQCGITLTYLKSMGYVSCVYAAAKFGVTIGRAALLLGGAIGIALAAGAIIATVYLWNNRVFY